jgi:hypothetical protein
MAHRVGSDAHHCPVALWCWRDARSEICFGDKRGTDATRVIALTLRDLVDDEPRFRRWSDSPAAVAVRAAPMPPAVSAVAPGRRFVLTVLPEVLATAPAAGPSWEASLSGGWRLGRSPFRVLAALGYGRGQAGTIKSPTDKVLTDAAVHSLPARFGVAGRWNWVGVWAGGVARRYAVSSDWGGSGWTFGLFARGQFCLWRSEGAIA